MAVSNLPSTLSNTEAWLLTGLSAACAGVLSQTWSTDGEPIYASIALSGIAYAMTYAIVRWTGPAFMASGRKGKDMSKKVSTEMYVVDPGDLALPY